MKYLPKGSLRSLLSIPQVREHNLSTYPCSEAAKRVKTYWENIGSNGGMAFPESEAISFYTLNHLAAVLQSNFDQDEVLPSWAQEIMREYVVTLADQGKRLYSYILLIITRESRHMHGWHGGVKPTVPAAWESFYQQIAGGNSLTVAKMFCNSPPNLDLGPYVRAVETCFFKGGFGGGYGGKPWGNIAQSLRRMVYGETSIATLVDTAYTLAHNNGPMFNKSMLYHTYKHDGTLLKILDVQRAGQMPEAVLNNELPAAFIVDTVRSHVKKMKTEFPTAFGEFVDWHKVESLGAVGKYAAEKEQQPAKLAPPKVINGKTWTPVGALKLMPNVAVTTMKREAA